MNTLLKKLSLSALLVMLVFSTVVMPVAPAFAQEIPTEESKVGEDGTDPNDQPKDDTSNQPKENTAPTITLNGDAEITLTIGATYDEQGATATDTEDGDISSSIVTAGDVDTTTAGTYTISYTISDSEGLKDFVARTVIVKEQEKKDGETVPDTEANTEKKDGEEGQSFSTMNTNNLQSLDIPTGLKRFAADDNKEFLCGVTTDLQILYPTWSAVTNADHYNYRSINPDENTGTERVINGTQFVHTWAPTEEGTYGFQVQAVGTDGSTSPWSSVCEITYTNTTTTPIDEAEITNLDAYYVVSGYKGIGVDISVDKLTDATEVEVRVTRSNGGDVVKTSKVTGSVLGILSTGNPATVTAPIVIQQGSYNEAGSSSWNQPTATWDSTTVPETITVTITRENGPTLIKTINISEVGEPFGTLNDVMPAPAVCTYDFQAQKMWEVTWGYDFENRNGGAPIFTKQSHGGLLTLNNNPLPAYMSSPTWHWLYVTDNGQDKHYDYGFADGTIWTVDVTWSNVAGCQIPTIIWEMLPPDTVNPVGNAVYSGGELVGDVIYINSIEDLSFTETVTDDQGVVRATYLVQKLNPITNTYVGFCGNWNANSSGNHILDGSTEVVYTETNIENCTGDLSDWTNGNYKIFHAAYDAAGNVGKYNTNRQVFVINKVLDTVVVTDADLKGWMEYGTATPGYSFVTDANAPLGDGALKIETADGSTYIQLDRELGSSSVAVKASDINLSYTTKRLAGVAHAAPAYVIAIDKDGNLTTTSDVFWAWYEPVYNDSTTTNYDEWNTWEITSASNFWYNGAKPAGAVNYTPLNNVLTGLPNAKVIGFTLNMGTGNEGWSALVDKVTTTEAIYDFEPSDTDAPTITISSPTEGEVLGASTLNITGTVTDENPRYHYCYLTTNQVVDYNGTTYTPGQEVGVRDANCVTTWSSVETDGNLGAIDMTGLPNGSYTINVVAYDTEGNNNADLPVSVTFDYDTTSTSEPDTDNVPALDGNPSARSSSRRAGFSTSGTTGGQVLGAESYNFTLLLKRGSRGTEVMELQKFLNANGYNSGVEDGIFGPITEAAVKAFQTANGLVADGIVGPLTRAVLNA